MSNDNENQAQAYGVTFGPLKRALREHRYPVTAGELIEQYGGFELATAAGDRRLESALQECEATTFAEPWEVRDAILGGLDDDAVVGYHGKSGESEAAESDDRDSPEVDRAGDWSRLSE
ncbi:hypothetical protein C471_10370 [Halorubrum saccharovorum DSM 1137]|uniref:DUF2795 domain-containing protein n=1 Tax=Halorubrum saccharovorum DSM 1137 TaxID=1227484 RepID=M0DU40_9EURY|nr:hypothetical protein [Halorubrum saccharovorum]ELZ38358.1 hypothetical protein C471_10370 [Halorubrum saccharovorum DSM 1137]